MDVQIHLKFGKVGVRVFIAKIVIFHPAIIKLQMRENGVFLVPVKYTLVCHVPTLAVLGSMTCYYVS